MIGLEAIDEIVAVYRSHGWQLRRLLLSPGLKRMLENGKSSVLGDAKVFDSDLDAAWFSRTPKAGGIPWEIRHLSTSPYALLENIDENAANFEAALVSVEVRLREVTAKQNGLTKSARDPQT